MTRLSDVYDPGLAEKAQTQRSQLGRECIISALWQRPDIAVTNQLMKGAVAATAKLVQVGGNRRERCAIRGDRRDIRGLQGIFREIRSFSASVWSQKPHLYYRIFNF